MTLELQCYSVTWYDHRRCVTPTSYSIGTLSTIPSGAHVVGRRSTTEAKNPGTSLILKRATVTHTSRRYQSLLVVRLQGITLGMSSISHRCGRSFKPLPANKRSRNWMPLTLALNFATYQLALREQTRSPAKRRSEVLT